MIGAAIVALVLSFLGPWLFTRPSFSGIWFGEGSGQIGDTIGGIMNPMVAMAGVFLTFLAFYIQVRANRLQYYSFREELNLQKDQFQHNQLEQQFYEMIRLHKENVNEVQVVVAQHATKSPYTLSQHIVTGRRAFAHLKREFELGYLVAEEHFPLVDDGNLLKERVEQAYRVFFLGISLSYKGKDKFKGVLNSIQHRYRDANFINLNQVLKTCTTIENMEELGYLPFEGHTGQLAHYYRHLFHTVKFIADKPDTVLTYEEKRGYLRILRSQLSNDEQAMLFYNWCSGFGKDWENDHNRYFTDYRMIHNLYDAMLLPGFRLKNFFRPAGEIRKEKDRLTDPMFESDD